MTSDELHQWMISIFGPAAGENAWQQFQQLPPQIREQMLAADSTELPSADQMRSLMQAFAQSGFTSPFSAFSSPSSSDTDVDDQAKNATLATDPKTGNPIGFQMPDVSSSSASSSQSSSSPASSTSSSSTGSTTGSTNTADSKRSSSNAINVDLAKQIALISLPTDSQTVVTGAQDRRIGDAFSAASLWLDSATTFNPGTAHPTSMTRAEWITSTIDRWAKLVSPVSKATAQALGSVFASRFDGNEDAVTTQIFAGPIQINVPDNLRDPKKLMETIGTASFSMQLGQSAANLATEVLGAFDQGSHLSDASAGSIVVQNAENFAHGLSIPEDEVLSYLALRELAMARLYANVPWLATQIQTLVEKYAQYISIDLDAIEQQLRDAGEITPEGLSGAVNLSNVAMSESPEQKQAKASLGRMLALLEGWVDAVTWRAGQASLPHIGQLREMMRRRRATGSPAEQTFRELMGLDLRPVDARQACAAWEKIMNEQGVEAADKLWRHPDSLLSFASHADTATGSGSGSVVESGSAAGSAESTTSPSSASSADTTPSGQGSQDSHDSSSNSPSSQSESGSATDWDASLDQLLREEAAKHNNNDSDESDSGHDDNGKNGDDGHDTDAGDNDGNDQSDK